VCCAVFHYEIDGVLLSVTTQAGAINGIIQPLLIAQDGWMVTTPEPGQVDSVFPRKGNFGKVDVRGRL